MKRVVTIIGITFGVLIICVGLFFLGRFITDKSFRLEDKYYGNHKYMDLDNDKLNKLIKDEESFVIFVYQPLCAASSALESVITTFMRNYDVSFYKISFSEMKETVLKDTVKYYPSVVIYKDGEVVDYLDANSGEDTEKYKTVESFVEWFGGHVKVKKLKKVKTEEAKIPEDVKVDAVLDNISYSEDKINIYFFWGDGCPHCKQEFLFFESLKKQYGDLFEVHSFEVWYNKDNLDLLSQLAGKMKHKIGGVPLTIIGNEVFEGFGTEYEAKMLNAILTQYKDSYDVYFDGKKN